VVLELDSSQIEVVGTPILHIESDPVSRDQQGRLMQNYLNDIVNELKKKKPRG
jgi:hypothetical protein